MTTWSLSRYTSPGIANPPSLAEIQREYRYHLLCKRCGFPLRSTKQPVHCACSLVSDSHLGRCYLRHIHPGNTNGLRRTIRSSYAYAKKFRRTTSRTRYVPWIFFDSLNVVMPRHSFAIAHLLMVLHRYITGGLFSPLGTTRAGSYFWMTSLHVTYFLLIT